MSAAEERCIERVALDICHWRRKLVHPTSAMIAQPEGPAGTNIRSRKPSVPLCNLAKTLQQTVVVAALFSSRRQVPSLDRTASMLTLFRPRPIPVGFTSVLLDIFSPCCRVEQFCRGWSFLFVLFSSLDRSSCAFFAWQGCLWPRPRLHGARHLWWSRDQAGVMTLM